MRLREPLRIEGPAPGFVPAYPLPAQAREERPLFVLERTVHMRTLHGWLRIPRGYVTDFGSIPTVATILTLANYRPLGKHAWAALAHDWLYAIGEPGQRSIADDVFRERMELDQVEGPKRLVMYRAVRWGGEGGYKRAHQWWESENFADPDTGARVAPLFPRVDAYAGQRWGRRCYPDWSEHLAG